MRFRVRKKHLGFAAVLLGGAAFLVALCYVLSPGVRVGWVRAPARLGADESLSGMAEDPDKDVRATAIESLVARGPRTCYATPFARSAAITWKPIPPVSFDNKPSMFFSNRRISEA